MGKAFEKQIKTIEDQGEKQINALEILKQKHLHINQMMIIILLAKKFLMKY